MAAKREQDRIRKRLRRHPVRDLVVDAMRSYGRPVSPTRLAAILDRSVGSVAYHVRLLEEAGVIELSEVGRARGAVEHFYVLAADDVVAIGDPLSELLKICHALTVPSEDGSVKQSELDDVARGELEGLLDAAKPKVLRVVRSAVKRAAQGRE